MVTTRRQQKLKEVALEPAKSPPLKRKEEALEPITRSPSPKRQQHHSNTQCAFLALPRELRDEIYKHVLETESSVTMKQRSFITKSGLLGTNNQICEEYLDAVLLFAPLINTTVRNHNFAHVVTFLNRLSEAQLKRFKADAITNARPRTIDITLTYSHTKQSTRPQLNRWLDRFDDPNRRGAEIQFRYEVDRESWHKGGYKQRSQARVTDGPRSSEERRKIESATSFEKRYGFW